MAPSRSRKKATVRKSTATKGVKRRAAAATPKKVTRKTKAKAATTKAKAKRASHPAIPPPPLAVRRCIFIDAENTSSEADLLRVIEHLQIDRRAQQTTLMAAGNWRAIGTGAARLLARSGAELVHSAPSPGVRDWSDLWIAVAAGRWLAQAQPGDRLEIVSDDRAFDAVLQAAAAVGVDFYRISYRTIPGVVSAPAPAEAAERERRPRRRGGRRHRRISTVNGAAVSPSKSIRSEDIAAPPAPAPRSTHASIQPAIGEAHAATHEEVRATLTRLTGGNPARRVNLDLLANALRDEGYTRPPGSQRLVTRLRHMKGIEVSPTGMVGLRSETEELDTDAPADPALQVADGEPIRPNRSRRRRRRGGRSSASSSTSEAAPADTSDL
jgi:hypothetical protein